MGFGEMTSGFIIGGDMTSITGAEATEGVMEERVTPVGGAGTITVLGIG